MSKRINYIDNLRWMTVSLLILYHAAIAYNTWDEANYIFFREIKPVAAIVSFISPWFMPLMFLLAGASAHFSLQKRSIAEFVKERFVRLGIPFVFGIIAIDPGLSFVADVTHNGYNGGFFAHYKTFFTKFTDLTGYDGGFTLGHFWFLGVLIIISLLSCIVIKSIGTVEQGSKKAAVVGLVLSILAVAAFDISFFGKRIPTYLCVYLLGYYFVSERSFVEKLCRLKWLFAVMFVLVCSANTVIFIFVCGLETLNTVCNYASFAFGVAALVTIGHDCLDFSNRFTSFNSKISYAFYIIHFPIVILCQYLLSLTGAGCITNLVITLIITYPLTYALCFAAERSRYIRVLFGSKAKRADRN